MMEFNILRFIPGWYYYLYKFSICERYQV